MGWESLGVVGFDLGPLFQGQTRIAKLKSALLTIGHRPSPSTATFSPVKVPVQHGPPAGAISQASFYLQFLPAKLLQLPVQMELSLLLLQRLLG